MFHPYVIDTSVAFNLNRSVSGGKRNMKQKLKVIVSELLGRQIQAGSNGHSSLEDARAVMELVRTKLARELHWGVEDPLLSVLSADSSPPAAKHIDDQRAMEAAIEAGASENATPANSESGTTNSILSRQQAFFSYHLSSARNLSLFQVLRAASKPPRRMQIKILMNCTRTLYIPNMYCISYEYMSKVLYL